MLLARRERQRIIDQLGPFRDDAHGPFGDAAELHDPLGEQIRVLRHGAVDLVEQLVQRDECRPLHVPMRLLALGLEIDAVGEPLIEEADDFAPAGLR